MIDEPSITETKQYRATFIPKELRPTLKAQFICKVTKHNRTSDEGKIFLHPLNGEINLNDYLAD